MNPKLKLNRRLWVTGLLGFAALGYSLLPINLGREIGMPSASCGSLWQTFFSPTSFADQSPAFDDACRSVGGDRLLFLGSLLLPLVLIAATRYVLVRSDLRRPPGTPSPSAPSADLYGATAHLAVFVVPLIPAAVLFATSKSELQRRHTGQALDLQVAYVITSSCLVSAFIAIGGGDINRSFVVALLSVTAIFFGLSFVLGVQSLLGSQYPGWNPTLVRGRAVPT